MVQLTRIYTEGGDKGKTSLGLRIRVSKTCSRIAAIGDVDEANASIGVARLSAQGEEDKILSHIQNSLIYKGTVYNPMKIDQEYMYLSNHSIFPIWYPPGKHEAVAVLLRKILEERQKQGVSSPSPETESKAISLLAIDTEQQVKPFYCVLFEGEIHHSISNEYIDSILRQNFHYELARNLGQLDQPQIRQANNGWNA